MERHPAEPSRSGSGVPLTVSDVAPQGIATTARSWNFAHDGRAAFLGGAAIADPPVLILDEPTSGLDSLSRRRLWKMIHTRAAAGTGVIVSTHYLDEAFYCNRLAIMNAGKVVVEGAPKEVAATQDDLLKYFRPR